MVKILVCGDIRGKFASVFSRVAKLKSQEFAALFCVGEFFAPDSDSRIQLAAYLSGTETIPIPTYFILGGEGEHTEVVDKHLDGGEICHNLQFLGRQGIATIAGLRVGFLSGVYNSATYRDDPLTTKYTPNYLSSQVESLMDHYRTSHTELGIDVFLSCEWGKGFSTYIPKDLLPTTQGPVDQVGSPVVGELLGAISTRYHFAGKEGLFFQLPVYKSSTGYTRFLGIGCVGATGQKDLYACNIASVGSREPIKVPEAWTENPYSSRKSTLPESASKRAKSGLPDFTETKDSDAVFNRWGLSQEQVRTQPNVRDLERGRGPNRDAPPRGYKCSICSGSNHFAVNCPKSSRGDSCWFCLGSPGVETHLVCSIGTGVYVALAKGPLDYDHFLLLPVDHVSSFYGLSRSTQEEFKLYKEALRKCYAKRHKKMVFWDRNIQTSRTLHMNMQALAIPEQRWAQAKTFIEKEAASMGIKFEDMDPQEHPGDENYLIIELDADTRLCSRQTNNRELFNFGRNVFAHLLGKPEATNWKACELTMAQETKIVNDFKQMFKPFEPSE